jgi:ribonuclease HII
MRWHEKQALAEGFRLVAGVDEVGRGPLAGPVVAAAVVFRPDEYLDGVRDSKQLSPKRREEFFLKICERAVGVGLGIVSEKVIDRINILRATQQAMRRAVASLDVKPDLVLVDGMRIPHLNTLQKAIPGGDRISVSIAAASIIAKVTRDRIMLEQDGVGRGWGMMAEEAKVTKKTTQILKVEIEASV